MGLLEIILEHNTPETLETELQRYAAEQTPGQLLAEIRKQPKIKAQASQRLRDTDTQFLLFQLVTGYEALEEITRMGKEGKPGSYSLKGLATLLFGVKVSSREVGPSFKLIFIQGTLQPNEVIRCTY